MLACQYLACVCGSSHSSNAGDSLRSGHPRVPGLQMPDTKRFREVASQKWSCSELKEGRKQLVSVKREALTREELEARVKDGR